MLRLGERTVALPLLTGLILGASLVVSWWQTRSRAERDLSLQTRLTAEQAAIRLEDYLKHHLAAVQQLRREFAVTGLVDDEERFRRVSSLIQEQYDGFLALNWVDPQGVLRWVVPLERNREAQGKPLKENPAAHRVYQAACAGNQLCATPPIELFQGGTGFTTYLPIAEGPGDPDLGALNGVFRIESLVSGCFDRGLRERYALCVRDSETADDAYVLDWSEAHHRSPYLAEAELRVGDRTWVLKLDPRVHPPGAGGRAALILALMGLSVTLALTLSLRQALLGRARHRALVTQLPDMVLFIGADGKVVEVSGSPRALPGSQAPPRVGARLEAACARADAPRVAEAWSRVAAGAPQAALTLRQGEGESPEVCELRLVSCGEGRSLALARDLSELRALEAKLHVGQKLELVGRLAGGIAHDFNNVLTAIFANAELARAQLPEDAPARADLDALLESAQFARDLVQRLLASSELREGQRRPLDLRTLVEGQRPFLRQLLPESIALEEDLPGEPLVVLGDRVQLEQVVLNLVVNARDALAEGGTLGLGLRALDAGELASEVADTGSWCRLSVRDDGEGIAPEILERVFEPFFSSKSRAQGTGLGLATVDAIVRRHSGHIRLESELGRGTEVQVDLPCAPLAALEGMEEVLTSSSSISTDARRVLVAEDQSVVRRSLAGLLRLEGFEVLEAEDGVVALEQAAAHPDLSLLITDLAMPRLEGEELVSRFRVEHPQVPIIVTSGFATEAPPGTELLLKPYTGEQLHAALARALA